MLDLNNGTGGFLGAIDETTLFFFTVCIRGTKRVKGLVKKYRGGGGWPEHLEIWLIKNT